MFSWFVHFFSAGMPGAGPRGSRSRASEAPLSHVPGGGSRGRAGRHRDPQAAAAAASFPVQIVLLSAADGGDQRARGGGRRPGPARPPPPLPQQRPPPPGRRGVRRAAMTSRRGTGARRKCGGRGRAGPRWAALGRAARGPPSAMSGGGPGSPGRSGAAPLPSDRRREALAAASPIQPVIKGEERDRPSSVPGPGGGPARCACWNYTVCFSK